MTNEATQVNTIRRRKRHDYVPNPKYFRDRSVVIEATHTAFAIVSKLVTDYVVNSCTLGTSVHNEISGTTEEKYTILNNLLDESLESTGDPRLVTLELRYGSELVFDARNGLPGKLKLYPHEFHQLSWSFSDRGLPEDLYHDSRSEKLRTVVERRFNRPVRVHRYLTQAQLKIARAGIDQTLPPDVKRRAFFAQAASDFLVAIWGRIAELTEPGHERTPGELIELHALRQRVVTAAAISEGARTVWPRIPSIQSSQLRTLGKGVEFRIRSISPQGVVLELAGRSVEIRLSREDVERAWRSLVSQGELTVDQIRVRGKALYGSYIAGLLAGLPEVQTASRPAKLRLIPGQMPLDAELNAFIESRKGREHQVLSVLASARRPVSLMEVVEEAAIDLSAVLNSVQRVQEAAREELGVDVLIATLGPDPRESYYSLNWLLRPTIPTNEGTSNP